MTVLVSRQWERDRFPCCGQSPGAKPEPPSPAEALDSRVPLEQDVATALSD